MIEQLEQDPFLGTDLGNNVRKIRIAIQSKGKGKRGGARVMTYAKVQQGRLYLFSIFNKGEQDTLSAKAIEKLVKDI
ncbi:hypothetical protein FACS1894199_07990 [Bacteroidia bacterium]|nr:hypothetical protein FACS1894199_07990 [Bacteroidia bacterium]